MTVTALTPEQMAQFGGETPAAAPTPQPRGLPTKADRQAALRGTTLLSPEQMAEFAPPTQEPLRYGEDNPIPKQHQPEFVAEATKNILKESDDGKDDLWAYRAATQAGGGFLGGKYGCMAGAAVGGPIGCAVGGMGGAVLGATIGTYAPEGVMEMEEAMGTAEEGGRERVGLTNAQLHREAQSAALWEAGFLGVGGALKAGGRIVGRTLAGTKKADQQLGEELAKQGIEATPGQLAGTTNMVTNVLGRLPLAGGKMRKFMATSTERLRGRLNALPERTGRMIAGSEVGQQVLEKANALSKAFGDRYAARYEQLFNEADALGTTYEPALAKASLNGVRSHVKSLRAKKKVARTDPTTGQIRMEEELIPASAGVEGALAELSSILPRSVQPMTLRQVDDAMKKIDTFLDELTPGSAGYNEARKQMLTVKAALAQDIAQSGTDEASRRLGAKHAQLDGDYSEGLNTLFETSTAKKFETVQRGGIHPKSKTRPSERATQVSPDLLVKQLVNMDSPQGIRELTSLVGRDTMGDVRNIKLNQAVDGAFTVDAKGNTKWNAKQLRDSFGFHRGGEARQEAWRELLSKSGSPISMRELETLTTAAEKFGSSAIPDTSTFLARRMTLGGIGSLIAVGSTASGGTMGLAGSLLTLFGARQVVSAVGDPQNAKHWRNVLRPETDEITRKASYLVLAKSALEATGHEATDSIDEMANEAWTETKRQMRK